MTWELFRGDGEPHDVDWPDPPPWRRFPVVDADGGEPTFQATPELVQAVNAALHLRRPLLLTGSPGSGKSSVADAIAHELRLGPVLRWHVTSTSTLDQAVYRYDALGRLQHTQRDGADDEPARYFRLGPLGTALVASTPERPRVLLVDELDKGELDLPGDLLNVLERGEYDIDELARIDEERVEVRGVESDPAETFEIRRGRIRCAAFPVVVMTSNGEREFPGPFLRRCVRFRLGVPDRDQLAGIVAAHLGSEVAEETAELIEAFAERLRAQGASRPRHAVDQLLSTVFLVTGDGAPPEAEREQLIRLVQRALDQT
ncbi:MAG: AAA family ATPase [Acidimicrobiales bacterium]